MHMQFHKIILLLSLLSALILLVSCGSYGVGTIPRGTPDHGNGTPAVLPTPGTDPQPVITAPPTILSTSYAFISKNQLWIALAGAKPEQVTEFDYGKATDIFWHQPAWSAGDHYIAFILNAQSAGLGGGGCPAPDYSANGALYLLDVGTKQLTQIVLPGTSSGTSAGSPYRDSWQYIFWQDSTHFLAWYNGSTGKTDKAAGLYRYDVTRKTLTQVLPLSSLAVATLFNVQQGLPLVLSMRYSSGQLFYQVVVHPFEQHSQFVLYRHSLVHPEQPASKVVETGSGPWCTARQNEPFEKPGWDVSIDGEQLVMQRTVADGSGQAVGSIQVLDLRDEATTGLFTQLSPQVLGRDLMLTWGPDNQTVVVAQDHLMSQDGPYTATLADPTIMQQYTPNLAGQVTWRSDSSAFALQSADPAGTVDTSAVAGVYVFVPGDSKGKLLLADAENFAWG